MATEWTTDTLKEYMDTRFSDLKQSTADALKSKDKAIELLAEDAANKYKELNDVRHRFIPREVFEQYKVDTMKAFDNYKDEQVKKGRATIVMFVLMGLTIVGLLLNIALRGS